MSEDEAEAIAVAAFGFIASDTQLVDRFCGLTGLVPAELRQAAAKPGFLAAVLDFLAGHEPDLLAFSASAAVPPERIAQARARLAPDGRSE